MAASATAKAEIWASVLRFAMLAPLLDYPIRILRLNARSPALLLMCDKEAIEV